MKHLLGIALGINQLMLHWPRKQPLLLLPVTTDLFVNIPGWRIRFTRDKRGHVAGFILDTTRLSNFRFDRVEQSSTGSPDRTISRLGLELLPDQGGDKNSFETSDDSFLDTAYGMRNVPKTK